MKAKSSNYKSDKKMSLAQAAYVAGFWDGEGTIGILRETRKASLAGFRYLAYMTVCNTDLGVLEAIRDMMGNGRIISNYQKLKKEHHKVAWKIILTANQIRHILPQLLPYLIIKNLQARLALNFLKLMETINNYSSNNVEKQHKYWQQAREMNRRGIKQTIIPFGGLRGINRPPIPTCSQENCNEIHYGKGYCRKHYRWIIESESYETRKDRKCDLCGEDIPDAKPINAHYCSKKCKARQNYLTRMGLKH